MGQPVPGALESRNPQAFSCQRVKLLSNGCWVVGVAGGVRPKKGGLRQVDWEAPCSGNAPALFPLNLYLWLMKKHFKFSVRH